MATKGSFNTTGFEASDGSIYFVFSWERTSYSIANNTSAISWTLKGGGTSAQWFLSTVKLTLDGGVVYNATEAFRLRSGNVVASGTLVIQHDDDGEGSFLASVTGGIYAYTSDNATGSQTFALDIVPRASTLTAGDGTLGVKQKLTIARVSNTFKHRLTYRCGSVADYILGSLTGYDSSTVDVDWTPPIGLAAENTTGTRVPVTLTLYTYTSDGTHVGTKTQTITCAIPTSVKPSVTIAWEDTTGVAALYGSPVQSLSKLKITLQEQTSYGSPIVSRAITANGVSYTQSPATTEALKSAGSNKIAATIKDQRARGGSNSATLVVLAYTAPVVSALDVHRCEEDGTENDQGDFIKATFSAAVTNLVNKNPAAYTLRYKAAAAENYTEVELSDLANVYTVTEYSHVFPADGNSSYEVEVVATDNHGTATRATTASTAFTLLNWNASGTGMGVGKVSEKENAVEFGLDLYDKNDARILGVADLVQLFYPVGSITLRYDHINPGAIYGGTWARISSYLLRGAAEGGNIGELGTLADGSGRTYINISIWRRTA